MSTPRFAVVLIASAALLTTTVSFVILSAARPGQPVDKKAAATADKADTDKADNGADARPPEKTPAKDRVAAKKGPKQNRAIGGDLTPDKKGTGTIVGIVHFKGVKPPMKPFAVPKGHRDGKTCGMTIPYERHVIGPMNELANAVVSLTSDALPKGKPRTFTLDNARCHFAPHVQATTARSELVVTSKDPILHTALGIMPGAKWGMNIAIPNPKSTIKKRLGPNEGWILFTCSTHAWMKAHVKVFNHDFFAVTGPDGRFELRGIPPGDYTLEMWHETNPLGALKTKVSVKAGESTEANLVLESSAK